MDVGANGSIDSGRGVWIEIDSPVYKLFPVVGGRIVAGPNHVRRYYQKTTFPDPRCRHGSSRVFGVEPYNIFPGTAPRKSTGGFGDLEELEFTDELR
jgi:hypothetical protein